MDRDRDNLSGEGADGEQARVAEVATRLRSALIGDYYGQLPQEDLQQLYQDAIEALLRQVAKGSRYETEEHLVNTLRKSLWQRVDNERKRRGLVRIVSIDGPDPALETDLRSLGLERCFDGTLKLEDDQAGIEPTVTARENLRLLGEVSAELGEDERTALAYYIQFERRASAQIAAQLGWSRKKYRYHIIQAQQKVSVLFGEAVRGQRCRRLSDALYAVAAGVSSKRELALVERHTANCPACRTTLVQLRERSRRAGRRLGIVLPAGLAAGLTETGGTGGVEPAGGFFNDLSVRIHGLGRGLTEKLSFSGPSASRLGETVTAGGGAAITKAVLVGAVVTAVVGGGIYVATHHREGGSTPSRAERSRSSNAGPVATVPSREGTTESSSGVAGSRSRGSGLTSPGLKSRSLTGGRRRSSHDKQSVTKVAADQRPDPTPAVPQSKGGGGGAGSASDFSAPERVAAATEPSSTAPPRANSAPVRDLAGSPVKAEAGGGLSGELAP